MKKALILVLGLVFFVGCSPDSETSSEIDSLDLTKIISPGTAAAAEFDNSSSGIYKGVFVSDDYSYHGVITVNVGNDSQYNAILEYGANRSERMEFVRINNESESSPNVIEYSGTNVGFTLDVSDYTQPVVTEGYIDGQGVQIKLLKETSKNPVRAQLGTFVDDINSGINGTWDMMGQVTRDIVIPNPLDPFNDITITVVVLDELLVTFRGTLEVDNVHEDFTPGITCLLLIPTLPPVSQEPFFSEPQTIPFYGFIDEYAAGDQTSFLFGNTANWNLIYSELSGGYYDTNCNTQASGRYTWGTRTGSIFVDP